MVLESEIRLLNILSKLFFLCQNYCFSLDSMYNASILNFLVAIQALKNNATYLANNNNNDDVKAAIHNIKHTHLKLSRHHLSLHISPANPSLNNTKTSQGINIQKHPSMKTVFPYPSSLLEHLFLVIRFLLTTLILVMKYKKQKMGEVRRRIRIRRLTLNNST